MEYIFSKNRSTPHDLVMELRINLIKVNSAFCKKKLEIKGDTVLDIIEMFDDPAINLDDFLVWAFETEGVLGDDEETERYNCENLIKRVKERMAEI